MKYHLIFFPWIGLVIGILMYGWAVLCGWTGIGTICYVLIGGAIPLLVTGGFHADGFMDTMDALSSYRTKEEKLQILKDPHIGAFSVIKLASAGLIYLAAFSEIRRDFLLHACAVFALSRCLSGIGVLLFPSAKKSGMLHTFAESAKGSSRNPVLWALILQFVLFAAVLMRCSLWAGIGETAVLLAGFAFYYFYTKKQLGGITGDTAGFFVVIAEIAGFVFLAVVSHIL